MVKLSLALVSEITNADVRRITTLVASERDLDEVDDISSCVELRKLDLSRNKLASIETAAYLQSLAWLNISNNSVSSLAGLEQLEHLTTLNASNNQIVDIEPLTKLKSLRVVVLNDNKIRDTTPLRSLKELSALVLSRNKIDTLDVRDFTKLKKLSVSHNFLRICPKTAGCYNLKEIRLNSNKITKLSDDLQSSAQLILIDMGNNILTKVENFAVIKHLKYLCNLNLKGNKIAEDPNCRQQAQDWVPKLRIYNGLSTDANTAKVIEKRTAKENLDSRPKKKKRKKHNGTNGSTKTTADGVIDLGQDEGIRNESQIKSNSKELDSSKLSIKQDRTPNNLEKEEAKQERKIEKLKEAENTDIAEVQTKPKKKKKKKNGTSQKVEEKPLSKGKSKTAISDSVESKQVDKKVVKTESKAKVNKKKKLPKETPKHPSPSPAENQPHKEGKQHHHNDSKKDSAATSETLEKRAVSAAVSGIVAVKTTKRRGPIIRNPLNPDKVGLVDTDGDALFAGAGISGW